VYFYAVSMADEETPRSYLERAYISWKELEPDAR
jgi:hypothetical protein